MHASVVAVARNAAHSLAKIPQDGILLIAGVGVDGDVHAGATVKHCSRLAGEATKPNLRQVHLIHAELHDELAAAGFEVGPAQMGENITTRGVDLLALPAGTRLCFGNEAVVKVTGLRNPCTQLDGLHPGLMNATLDRGPDGELVRKTGVMSVVVSGGEVRPGDPITVELPPPPHMALQPV